MAQMKVDEAAARTVKADLERLIKSHGVDVVTRVFNRHLGALREIRKLEKERRALAAKVREEKGRLNADFMKVQKKLG